MSSTVGIPCLQAGEDVNALLSLLIWIYLFFGTRKVLAVCSATIGRRSRRVAGAGHHRSRA